MGLTTAAIASSQEEVPLDGTRAGIRPKDCFTVADKMLRLAGQEFRSAGEVFHAADKVFRIGDEALRSGESSLRTGPKF